MYFKDQAGNWRAVANGAFTTAADKIIDFPFPTTIKGTLSGSTAASLVVVFR